MFTNIAFLDDWFAQQLNQTNITKPKFTCDGQQCGTGTKNQQNKWICSHNNLERQYPLLVKEWNFEKNKHRPSIYLPYSTDKVWWQCSDSCGCHCWQAKISNRVQGKDGCPFCKRSTLCTHSNITISHPYLCDEYDYKRNSLSPDNYTRASNATVWWICSKGHNWQANITHRIYQELKCTVCSVASL